MSSVSHTSEKCFSVLLLSILVTTSCSLSLDPMLHIENALEQIPSLCATCVARFPLHLLTAAVQVRILHIRELTGCITPCCNRDACLASDQTAHKQAKSCL